VPSGQSEQGKIPDSDVKVPAIHNDGDELVPELVSENEPAGDGRRI
jgi:hypothetical protein